MRKVDVRNLIRFFAEEADVDIMDAMLTFMEVDYNLDKLIQANIYAMSRGMDLLEYAQAVNRGKFTIRVHDSENRILGEVELTEGWYPQILIPVTNEGIVDYFTIVDCFGVVSHPDGGDIKGAQAHETNIVSISGLSLGWRY